MSKLRQFYQNKVAEPALESESINGLTLSTESFDNLIADSDLEESMFRTVTGIESLSALMATFAAREVSVEEASALSATMESILAHEGAVPEDMGIEAFVDQDPSEWVTVSNERLGDKLSSLGEIVFLGGFEKNAKKAATEAKRNLGYVHANAKDNLDFIKKNKAKISEIDVPSKSMDTMASFFIRDGAPVKASAAELETDTRVIADYAKLYKDKVLPYIKDLSAALSSAPKTDEEAVELFSKLSKLSNPLMADNLPVGDGVLLNNFGIYYDEEKPIKFNNDVGTVSERRTYRMFQAMDSADAANDGSLAGLVLSGIIKFVRGKQTEESINAGALLDLAQGQLRLVDAVNDLADVITAVANEYDILVGRLKDISKKVSKDISSANAKDLKALWFLKSHVKAVVRNPAYLMMKYAVILSKKINSFQQVLRGKVQSV